MTESGVVDREANMQLFESFISYRRSETLPEVQNIYHALTSKGYSTFCDIYSLKSGRFDTDLLEIIKRCTNFILVLNRHSLDRCVDDEDWLRFEIRTAIKEQKNIICVFTEEMGFPDALPDDIDDIRYINGLKYDFVYFNGFIDALCSRFLVKESDTEVSDPKRDFVIINTTVIKYIGNANIVNIPDDVKIIGRYAFKDKTRITEIFFPEGLECIETHAFERCINLTNLIFPDSLEEIGDEAFSRCYNLSFVAFNDGLKSIGENSFSFCGKLKVIRFGKKISRIPSSAFNDCDKLAIIDIDEDNCSYITIEGILYSKDIKRIIRCPEGYSSDLISVEENVESIEPWCFSKCINLVDVILPKHLKRIGAYAFSHCRNIISLTLGDEVEEFNVTALDGWDRGQRIVVSKRFNPIIKYQIDKKISEKVVLQHESGPHFPTYIMIKTTFESIEEATKMAKMLINKRYIASAQIDHLNVFYTWNDQSCNENEIELSCITRGSLYNIVETFIKQNHSYECCQIICLPIIHSSNEFGNWINEQTINEE